MRRLLRTAPLALPLVAALGACPAVEEGECASAADCAPPGEAPCDGCPPVAAALCEEAACVARADDAVDVEASLNLDRDVAPQVVSIVHVLASGATAAGPLACRDAFAGEGLAPGVNVLAAGTKALSGGSFHEDVGLGRAPEGPLVVVVLGKDGPDGGGALLLRGCADGLLAAAPALDVALIELSRP